METKKCQYCKGEIIGKRGDAKFCSSTCKAKHWEEKKLSTTGKEEKNVTSQLRGVLNDATKINTISETGNKQKSVFETVEIRGINLGRALLQSQYRRLTDVRKALETEMQSLQNKLKQANSINGNTLAADLTVSGASLGNQYPDKKLLETVLWASIVNISSRLLERGTDNNREGNKKRLIEHIQTEIQNKQKRIQEVDKELKIQEDKLQTMPLFETVKIKLPVTIKKPIENNTPFDLSMLEVKSIQPFTRLQKDVYNVQKKQINSDKIISSGDLNKMEFPTLNFQGKWLLFFGYPSLNFHLVLYGMSGEGKSTLAIQFAKYLADKIGRVIYISGEEGFSKTFKDKFSNNNAESEFLDVADLRTFDDILREVQPETYNFIFIDSLDTMKIDADKMKKLRERYKNSALITISQSTKDGKMRGSYEIVHDSDIAVKVEKGIATTIKNRFKETGMTLDVFEKK